MHEHKLHAAHNPVDQAFISLQSRAQRSGVTPVRRLTQIDLNNFISKPPPPPQIVAKLLDPTVITPR